MKKIILSILLISAVSCRDFLVNEPVESISINTQLSTKKGMLEALNAVYYRLSTTYFSEAVFSYGDLLSGNLKFSPKSTGAVGIPTNVDDIYNFDDISTSSNLANFYSESYQIINNINLILDYAGNLPDATPEEISEIKAETFALRAFVHFQLYKYYGQNYTYTSDASHLGIAYNTAPLKVGVDYPGRKTVAETFTLLENDISEALSLIQQQHAIPAGLDKNYIRPAAIKTIAAEIALWKNDWQKAYEYSNDVINNSGISLTPKSELVSNWAFSESIWELPKDYNNDFPASRLYSLTNTSTPLYVASDDLYNLYASNDLRKNLFDAKNIKTTGITTAPTYYFTKKYKGNVNSLIYRLSLLYFIRAEAAFKTGNTNQALLDINTIRNRAGLSSLTSVSTDLILEEKRREFPFENEYFFDLMRNHKNIVRTNGCISSNCSPSYPNVKFVAPVPQNAVNLNSNIKQNPEY